jgi:hypothetical protein
LKPSTGTPNEQRLLLWIFYAVTMPRSIHCRGSEAMRFPIRGKTFANKFRGRRKDLPAGNISPVTGFIPEGEIE